MLLTLALASLLHAAAPADSLAGPWRIIGDVAGNPINIVCTFKQAGTALSGECTGTGAEGKYPMTGELKDGKLSFSHGGDYQGQALTLSYSGTLQGAQIKGSVAVQPFNIDGAFTAAPVTPKP